MGHTISILTAIRWLGRGVVFYWLFGLKYSATNLLSPPANLNVLFRFEMSSKSIMFHITSPSHDDEISMMSTYIAGYVAMRLSFS